MGQQPNVPLEIEDLPRRTAKPAAPGRWSPDRPGDLSGPSEVPWGGTFGTPGPDAGYALSLLRGRDLPTVPGEGRDDLVEALMALMVARASLFGRAPMVEDAAVAEALLAVGGADPAWRLRWTAGLADWPHHAARLVEAVDRDALLSTPDDIRAHGDAGERLVGQRAEGTRQRA